MPTIVRPLNDEDWSVIERYTRKTHSLHLIACGLPTLNEVQKLHSSSQIPPSPDSLSRNLQVLMVDLEVRYISHLRLSFGGLPLPIDFEWTPWSPSRPFIEVTVAQRGFTEVVSRASSMLPWAQSIQPVSWDVSNWEDLENRPELWDGFKSSICTHINLSTITSRSRGQFHVSSNKTEYTPFTPLRASCSENRVLHAVKTARRTWSCSPPSHSSTGITSGVVLLNTSAFVLQQSTVEPCLHLKYLRILVVTTYYDIDLSDCFIERMG
ncbi:hypothetical protein M404DRAFT_33967 [Pisolithus tinctorius Marx 270]|uniref:Uncharacterized protein n=1 Tax=Pisolithus tinctorius Marx 270 TaxID=870435 RepID=A0A0C3N3T9_PISTI|nr:hypothetical protein M404DRAFT_33967 [Pisolithus tinctorius Marx 270]